MIDDALRKARQVIADRVLRQWLLRMAVGLEESPSGFVAGHPPYLTGEPEQNSSPIVTDIREAHFSAPAGNIRIQLPGLSVELSPDDPSALFGNSYADLETLLGAHRFAWVPMAGGNLNPDWVAFLWTCWAEGFGDNNSGWPWHAYTAAERAINIIDFARQFGLPGEKDATLALLAKHAGVIRGGLEYFGDHYTSNHLSNNGRGLLRIGTALGLEDHARTGATIMVAEAGRIFGRSGVLREGSTHYHLLLTRNYIDAWLDARAGGLDQADTLREIAERAIAAIPGLCLPGGVPLIGDISPDVSPSFLGYLTRDRRPEIWPENLPADRRRAFDAMIKSVLPVSPDRLADDGWHRFGGYSWQALAYVPPDGLPPIPGHGHQDMGSFELHEGETPVIIDPGRGSYADSLYEAAAVHNGVMIDGRGPVPVNRPYYDAAFRARVVGAPPEMRRTRDGRILCNAGFGYSKSVKSVEREWYFNEKGAEITDRLIGRGRRNIRRQFCIPHPVVIDGDTVIINAGTKSYRLSFGAGFSSKEIVCWRAYGQGIPGNLIVSESRVPLPCELRATIERV